MTQKRFSKLVREYERDDISLKKKDRLVKKIEKARDTDFDHCKTYAYKNDGLIMVVSCALYDDDCSPDGYSYCYDAWTITHNNKRQYVNGGCYWGYKNCDEMLKSEGFNLKEMKNVSGEQDLIYKMIYSADINYKSISSRLNKIGIA